MSRSNLSPVPRLDLAPKLKRPLSLKNPLNYLQLLYWIFFFPKALFWYSNSFGGQLALIRLGELTRNWEQLRYNARLFKLFIQGVISSAILLLLFEIPVFLLNANRNILSMLFNFTISIPLAATVILIFYLSFRSILLEEIPSKHSREIYISSVFSVSTLFVAIYILFNHLSSSTYDIKGETYSITLTTINNLISAAFLGLIVNTSLSISFEFVKIFLLKTFIVPKTIIRLLPISFLIIIPINVLVLGRNKFSSSSNFPQFTNVFVSVFSSHWQFIIISGLGISIFLILITLRFDDWFISLIVNILYSNSEQKYYLPKVTLLPVPLLKSRALKWFEQDWERGIYNVKQVLTYTNQFVPMIQALNSVLSRISPNELVPKIFHIGTYLDWETIVAATENSNSDTLLISQPVTGTPAQAVALGFYYLDNKELNKAASSFRGVRYLPYAEEMFILSQGLAAYTRSYNPDDLLQIFPPPNQILLRPKTWEIIDQLRQIVEDSRVVKSRASRTIRSLILNRAIGKLTTIIDEIKVIPQPEQVAILKFSRFYRDILLDISKQLGQILTTEPVRNPYVVGDPATGPLFVGRDDILERLEELWFLSPQLQSVVLYGHRRMGKTSILRNMEHRLGDGVKIAYINFLNLGNVAQGVVEVLMAISDAITDVVDLPAPADTELLNLPYVTFNRFIQQVDKALGEKRLIIALDEFEKIETLIRSGQISDDFWEYLRGLVQRSPKIALAFAGLHTLDETIGDYQHPFFASIIPIPVRFLDLGSIQLLLEDPSDEFPLTYAPEVLHQIYALTAGQPYLVQLIGFQLVRRYNNQVFNQGRTRDPQLNTDDLTAIIQDPEFFNQGRYYFTGVWGQANQDAPGQQDILRALAPHPQGLDQAELMQITGFTATQLTPALATLKKHDVIQQTENKWQIIVELFRRWVIDHT